MSTDEEIAHLNSNGKEGMHTHTHTHIMFLCERRYRSVCLLNFSLTDPTAGFMCAGTFRSQSALKGMET